MPKDIYIIDGARTPFLKSRNRPGPFSASDLATAAGKALLVRQPFAPTELDEVILGCAAPSVDEVNIGRCAAHGLRAEGPGLDRDAQLRLRHAGARFRRSQHALGALEPGPRGRRGRALARAAPLLGSHGHLVLELHGREDLPPARRHVPEIET